MLDANVQNTIKNLQQTILYQSEWPNYISSDQGMYFMAHNVQQCPLSRGQIRLQILPREIV